MKAVRCSVFSQIQHTQTYTQTLTKQKGHLVGALELGLQYTPHTVK